MGIDRHHCPLDCVELRALAKRSGLTTARCDALSHALPAAVDSLWRRQAWEVPDGHLDDYVALGWMNWSAGALLLTPAGRVVRDVELARMAPR